MGTGRDQRRRVIEYTTLSVQMHRYVLYTMTPKEDSPQSKLKENHRHGQLMPAVKTINLVQRIVEVL
jgi:hypothetical protein